MFVIVIEFDDGLQLLELDNFDDLWEIKEFFESEGLDVEWEYEPA